MTVGGCHGDVTPLKSSSSSSRENKKDKKKIKSLGGSIVLTGEAKPGTKWSDM